MSNREINIETEIVHINYQKNLWASFRVDYNDTQTNVSGNIPSAISVGDVIKLVGIYYNDDTYGPQIKIKEMKFVEEVENKSTSIALYNYLCSTAVKYVTPKMANEIINAFGENTIKYAEEQPELFLQINGIKEKRYLKITDSIIENQDYLDIIEILPDATINQMEALHKRYGKKAKAKLLSNPYRVIYDLDGYGFKKADSIANKLGVKTLDKKRIGAAIVYLIKTQIDFGNCYVTVDDMEYLLTNSKNGIIPELVNNEELIADVLADEIINKHLILEDKNKLYLPSMYVAETNAARMIRKLINNFKDGVRANKYDIKYAIDKNKETFGFDLDESQIRAVKFALSQNICAITGGPGTGKSTIVNTLINAYQHNPNIADTDNNIILLAPTGKASNRLKEITHCDAITNHLFILKHKTMDIGDYPLFIVDETSMIDLNIAYNLLSLIDLYKGKVIFIGDVDQLPAIGPGNFFKDLLSNKYVPKIRLKQCHRNKGKIANVANIIRTGGSVKSFTYDDTFHFLQCDKEFIKDNIIKAYNYLLKSYEPKDIGILVPRRKGVVNNKEKSYSAYDLNNYIQLNYNHKSKENTLFGFGVNDRVMQTVNDYEMGIFNGDVGTVTNIDTDEQLVAVKTDDNKIVIYDVDTIKNLTLAYSITIHKSQGSEYKAVILGLSVADYTMLQRNLLYTAVTRAKQKLYVIGEAKAFDIAISKVDAIERKTKLNARLDNECKRYL